ncbi:MAG TPA: F0F1 ATP synthase subunit B [Elusimicrobiota bacterium]|nr:F0F1 ATP synthase subunit B [Elusimicrobiota bacterium]
MDNLLNPDLGLSIFTILTFLVLVAVLAKFAWRPLLQTLDERESGIRRAIDDANMARQSADEMKIQYQRALAEGQDKTQAMIRQAEADAQKLREQLVHDAETEARRIVEQSRSQLEDEKEKLSRDLRRQAASLSVRVAERLLHHAMNMEEQDALLQNFLKDVEKESN